MLLRVSGREKRSYLSYVSFSALTPDTAQNRMYYPLYAETYMLPKDITVSNHLTLIYIEKYNFPIDTLLMVPKGSWVTSQTQTTVLTDSWCDVLSAPAGFFFESHQRHRCSSLMHHEFCVLLLVQLNNLKSDVNIYRCFALRSFSIVQFEHCNEIQTCITISWIRFVLMWSIRGLKTWFRSAGELLLAGFGICLVRTLSLPEVEFQLRQIFVIPTSSPPGFDIFLFFLSSFPLWFVFQPALLASPPPSCSVPTSFPPISLSSFLLSFLTSCIFPSGKFYPPLPPMLSRCVGVCPSLSVLLPSPFLSSYVSLLQPTAPSACPILFPFVPDISVISLSGCSLTKLHMHIHTAADASTSDGLFQSS